MPSFDISLSIKQDGADVAGFPIVRRLMTPKAIGGFTTSVASAGTTTTWQALPVTDLSVIGLLVLHADQPLLVRYADQVDGVGHPALALNQGGLLLWIDAAVGEGGASGTLRVNNTSGATATVQGVAGGT